MKSGLQKARYLSSVSALYFVTLALLWYVVAPLLPSTLQVQAQPTDLSPLPITGPTAFDFRAPIVRYGMPTRVVVPQVKIEKEVLPGEYNAATNSWTLHSNKAFFAMPTSLPNDYSGNTLIYGHNNRHAFGPLARLVPGDIAEVFTDNKLRFTYRFVSAQDINPKDITIFQYEGPARLTLQTCSGLWNEIRRLYTFEFEKAETV